MDEKIKKQSSLEAIKALLEGFDDIEELAEKDGEKEEVSMEVIEIKPKISPKKKMKGDLSAEEIAKLLSGDMEESPVCEDCGCLAEECKCEVE